MGKLEELQVKEEITSSPDKFYSFYRNNFTEFADTVPDKFNDFWLVKGKENCVGSVTHCKYMMNGVEMSLNFKIDAIDDENKTIIYNFIDGDFKKWYKSIRATLKVKEGYAVMTYEFEKAYEDAPDPADTYGEFAAEVMLKALDDHLVKN